MAQEGKEQDATPAKPQYSLVVSTTKNNDLRISCNNQQTIKEVQKWFLNLTKQDGGKVLNGKAKYTNATVLDSARKDKLFGEYDWDQIIIDYMLSKGFTLVGDGNSIKISSGDYARQQTKLIFLSPKTGNISTKPPAYTMQ